MGWVTQAEIAAAEARAKFIESWSEKELQEHIVGVARSLGWWAYHTYDSRRSQAGYPDLHLIRGTASIFRELKTKKGRLSPAQVECSSRMLAAGLDFAVWRPADVISGAIVQQLQELGR
jgi:hypothetical protein